MLGDADVEHAACVMNDEEDVEHAERRGEDLAVVTKEFAPPLLRLAIRWSLWHRSGDGPLRHVETEPSISR